MRARMSQDQVTTAKHQLAMLLQQGLYIQEICRRTRLPETSVRRWATDLGLTIPTCRSGPLQGPDHPEWRGGRTYDKHGYVRVWMPMHPQANNSGRCWEHRIVCETVLLRYLRPEEVVDHGDDHPRHNWPGNLKVYKTNAEHRRATLTGRLKSSPRGVIPGAYRSTQKLDRCPDECETLAQYPSDILDRLAYFVESHRPTSAHRTVPRRELHLLGARRDPWI
jgi:hypothetical protein